MNKVLHADYSFEQISHNGFSLMDDSFAMAYGLHRIAYAEVASDGQTYVRFVEFVGYLRNMPVEFEQLYNLPENVWCEPNARGLAKSKNIINRVVYYRLSSMTESEDA
jgi:hypothetical protein